MLPLFLFELPSITILLFAAGPLIWLLLMINPSFVIFLRFEKIGVVNVT
jgi:hypothetical protein